MLWLIIDAIYKMQARRGLKRGGGKRMEESVVRDGYGIGVTAGAYPHLTQPTIYSVLCLDVAAS